MSPPASNAMETSGLGRPPRRARRPGEQDSAQLATLLEVIQALTSAVELKLVLQRVADVLARYDGATRTTIAVRAERGIGEFDVEAFAGAAGSGARPIAVPISVEGRQMGTVSVLLRPETARAAEGARGVLRVVAFMIGQALKSRLPRPTAGSAEDQAGTLRERLEGVEKEALQQALRIARGNRAKAARLLATTERIFNYRIRKYGIDWRRFKGQPTVS